MSSKHLALIALFAVLALGFFLRAYHFSDWLHFELDQSRDARVIDAALSGGPGQLTLLGPKAGGTFLRLAPGFYYIQYASGLIFGGSPSGIALLVMVLSVLSVWVFYLLVRRFFPRDSALGLALLFAVSEYLVMYGRFAWNPNLVPFFALLGFYALLRAVDRTEAKKTLWFLLAAFSITLTTHFHFLAFLSLPTITVLFLLVTRPRLSWRAWAGAVAIVLVLYLPMALNELETGGANTKEFFGAIGEKSNKEEHSLPEKLVRDLSEHALAGIVITTGFEGATLPSISFSGKRPVPWYCDASCDRGKYYGAAGAAVLALGALSLVVLLWKEKERRRRDFLILAGLWFLIPFLLYAPLAYGIAPRFFLVSAPTFFIFLGCLFMSLAGLFRQKHAWAGKALFWLLILSFAASNLWFLSHRFSELRRAGTEAVDSAPDRILKERARVTLEQENAIVAYMKSRSDETGYPVYMFSDPQYRRALKYLMERAGIQNDVLGFSGIYREGLYYLVVRTESNVTGKVAQYADSYTEGSRTPFGTLTMIELIPKPEAVMGERQDFSLPDAPSKSQAPPRYTWSEFFARHGVGGTKMNTDPDTALDDQEDQEVNSDN